MNIERKVKIDLAKLDKWLAFPREMIEVVPQAITIRRDNLIAFPDQYLELSRWLTWAEQTPEIEQESATGLRYASKMYAAFLKLAEQPEQEQTFKIYDLP